MLVESLGGGVAPFSVVGPVIGADNVVLAVPGEAGSMSGVDVGGVAGTVTAGSCGKRAMQRAKL